MGYRSRRRYGYDRYDQGWAPYVPVAERHARAGREAARLARKGSPTSPVVILGRKLATTFWGQAWCDHIEGYRDYANRLPRGRTYVRNGSVIHLSIAAGLVEALVSGSDTYSVKVSIPRLAPARWKHIVGACAGRIESVVELLSGKLERGVMESLCDAKDGLFPGPRELEMSCSCPDYATMCKHVAATLYGVGARLDARPELLFTLRGVSHDELVAHAGAAGTLAQVRRPARGKVLAADDLGAVFGIQMGDSLGAGPRRDGRPEERPRAIAPRKAAAASRRPQSRERISSADLLARGIPRSTFQNWLQEGVLLPTGERGVYFATDRLQARIETALERMKLARSGSRKG